MTDILTLNGWGQRASSFRFDLLDPQLDDIGTLEVGITSASIENNINRVVKRQLNNVDLFPVVGNDVNPLRDRVRPWMIMQDGTEYPLGVFMFSDYTRLPVTGLIGTTGFQTCTLLDQGMILDQPTNRSYGFKPGTLISTAITRLLQASPITQFVVEASGSKVRGSEWVTWPAGTTTLDIINDLCGLGSYYSLYFDNWGVAQVKLVPDLSTTEPTLRYGSLEGEQTIYNGTIMETDDLLSAPNRYIVVNNALNEEPVVGSWDVPASSPNSKEQRGFVVATVVDKQGVETNAEATAAAKAYGQSDYNTYSWVTFDAAPNPLHDTFNIVAYEGVSYREQNWRLPLEEGGDHNHELRRIFNEEDFIEAS